MGPSRHASPECGLTSVREVPADVGGYFNQRANPKYHCDLEEKPSNRPHDRLNDELTFASLMRNTLQALRKYGVRVNSLRRGIHALTNNLVKGR